MIAVSLTAVNTFALVPCLHFLGMWPSMVGFLFVVSYLFLFFFSCGYLHQRLVR